jgi:hypothetical protein
MSSNVDAKCSLCCPFCSRKAVSTEKLSIIDICQGVKSIPSKTDYVCFQPLKTKAHVCDPSAAMPDKDLFIEPERLGSKDGCDDPSCSCSACECLRDLEQAIHKKLAGIEKNRKGCSRSEENAMLHRQQIERREQDQRYQQCLCAIHRSRCCSGGK